MASFTADLERFDVPTLLLHGDDDQIVPIAATSEKAARIVPNATLKVFAGAPHGLCVTHANAVNTELLAFINGGSQ